MISAIQIYRLPIGQTFVLQATSSSRWILPVMQGFIQERTFEIEDPTNLSGVYDQSVRH